MDRTPRIFFDSLNEKKDSIIIKDEQVKHIKKSLRMNIGDEIIAFDGENSKFITKIDEISNHSIILNKIEKLEINKPRVSITLAQGIPKSKKMDDIIRRLTEIGIKRILPIQTDYSQIKSKDILKKYNRWETIIIEACKQSERDELLEIGKPMNFDDIVDYDNYDIKILASNKGDAISLNKVLNSSKDINSVLYVIGPEGGFSQIERELAMKSGFVQVSINTNILRTETAAIYLGSILNFRFN